MLTHLNFKITDLPEIKELHPFERPNAPKDSPFKYVPFWKRQKLDAPKNLRVSYYLQEAGHEVPWHKDDGPLCSLNLLIKGTAPIRFEDEDIYYECMLFDSTIRHMVPATDIDRLILKMSVLDRSYEDVKNDLAFGLQDRQEVTYRLLLETLSKR